MAPPHLRLVGRDHDAGFADAGGAVLVSVLRHSPDCIKVIEPGGLLGFMNANGLLAMQIDDFEAVRGTEWALLWPEDARATVRRAVERGFAGEATRFESACPTARGEARWWDVSVAPVEGRDGRIERLVAISRDVTLHVERERRLAEHEAQLAALNAAQAAELVEKAASLARTEVVMREVDHRVKNSLNLVSSMLKMQSRRTVEAARQPLREAADRVALIARVHEALYGAASLSHVDMRDFLEGLSKGLMVSSAAPGVRLETAFCDRTLTGQEAVALGLILAELVGNALRHGLEGRDGALRIACEEAPEGRTRLSVGDSGAGFDEGFDLRLAEGLGSKVIQTYAAKIGGDVRTGRSPLGGAEVAVIF